MRREHNMPMRRQYRYSTYLYLYICTSVKFKKIIVNMYALISCMYYIYKRSRYCRIHTFRDLLCCPRPKVKVPRIQSVRRSIS